MKRCGLWRVIITSIFRQISLTGWIFFSSSFSFTQHFEMLLLDINVMLRMSCAVGRGTFGYIWMRIYELSDRTTIFCCLFVSNLVEACAVWSLYSYANIICTVYVTCKVCTMSHKQDLFHALINSYTQRQT